MKPVVTCRHQPQKHCRIQEILEATKPRLPPQPGGLFGNPIAISACIDELAISKRLANRREPYIKSLRHYLGRFAAGREKRTVCDFTTADIEAWLAQFQTPYSRQTWLNRIQTLFSFAVRRGYISANPALRIERVRVDRKPPAILSPAQADLLLKTCPTLCLPGLILCLYAGIRPDEAMKLNWSDIDLETKTCRVNEAKTRRRRIVPLEARAVALLSAFPLKSGPICPSLSTVRRFKRTARKVLGWEAWKMDVLRHSAASYLLALHKDAGKVATMLGNSSAILLAHYHEPVSEADCRTFWGWGALPAHAKDGNQTAAQNEANPE